MKTLEQQNLGAKEKKENNSGNKYRRKSSLTSKKSKESSAKVQLGRKVGLWKQLASKNEDELVKHKQGRTLGNRTHHTYSFSNPSPSISESRKKTTGTKMDTSISSSDSEQLPNSECECEETKKENDNSFSSSLGMSSDNQEGQNIEHVTPVSTNNDDKKDTIKFSSSFAVIRMPSNQQESSSVLTPVTPFRSNSSLFSGTPNIHTNSGGVASLEKHRKKCLLSLTNIPRNDCKRKLELSNDKTTPKKQKTAIPKLLKPKLSSQNATCQYVAPDQVKHDDDLNSTVANVHLLNQIEEKRKMLEHLKSLHNRNEQTKRLIKQWTEGGIRALIELSETRTPEIGIGLILGQLDICHELFGYDETSDGFP